MDSLLAYLPQDRRAALAAGLSLPDHCTGAALFADISGFMPLTAALTTTLGPRRGGEALTDQINAVYAALIAPVDYYGGSVIGFAGDAITCWFDDARPAPARRAAAPGAGCAVACALAQQAAMAAFAALPHPAGAGTLRLALKVAVASGPARRFLVGDPAVQVLEVLAGGTVQRMAAAEHLAAPGEVVVDASTSAECGVRKPAGFPLWVAEWRTDPATGERFAVLHPTDQVLTVEESPIYSAFRTPQPTRGTLRVSALAPEALRPWLPAAVYARLLAGHGEFLTELRPAVACFLRFGGLDYDADPGAGAQLDGYIRWVQHVVGRTDGALLNLTVGDKGNYLCAAWGALSAHEDDARRAVAAAAELATPRADLGITTVQIGLSQGVMRTGAYGSATRRTYGVQGNEVNLAARLMQGAAPGQVLASVAVQAATAEHVAWTSLPPIAVKGQRELIAVYALHPAAPAPLRLPDLRASGPLVGRAAEQAQIRALLARVRAGQGQVVGITGEAGIGKSRLAAEAWRACQGAGWAVYGAAAQSYGINTAYLAWQGIWQAFFDLAAGADLAAQQAQVVQIVAAVDPALVARVPLLGAVLGLPLPDTALTASMDEQLRQESREALLLDLLRGRARRGPLLLVIEDAHWLDPLSHDLLEAAGRAIADLPVALLVAYRPPAIARLQAPRVTALPHFTEVALRALPPEEATRLLADRLAWLLPEDTPVPRAAVERLAARAQGNPFYLEELASYLVEQGVDPADPAALAAVELPASLHSLVLSRLDQLATRQQRTLK
ncbi:MAG TPA: AAA family ATPase, partial [Chloroflexia bacterium]|nr:AAA family ATPase [Chloroflexia bacterium]